MPDLLQAIKNVFGSLDNEPKTPLHVGEVMSLWTYLVAIRESVVIEESCLNITTNPEVVKILHEAIEMCRKQADTVEKFLINEGVPLPPTSSDKTSSDPDEVPMGVKLTDDEITNTISLKVASAVMSCAIAQSQSIRHDVGIMLVRLQMEQVTFGATLKTIMRKNNWLKIPPYYVPNGLPRP